MKHHALLGCLLLIGILPAGGQTPSEIDQLKTQLQQARAAFEKVQAEHQRQMDLLDRKIQEIESRGKTGTNPPPAPVAAADPVVAARPSVVPAPALPPVVPAGEAAPPAVAAKKWSPSDPIGVRSGSAYMNISFDGLIDAGGSTAREPGKTLQLGGHDPVQRGFSLPNAELALEGAVDPYFKGLAIAAVHLDSDNETHLELEEAYVQTTSLPGNFQLKAGQHYAAFGRQNPQHPHQWAFVDQPLILNRALGPDGLRNPGVQGSWLAPLPFYTELFLGVMNGSGATAFSFRNRDDGAGASQYLGRDTLDRHVRGPGDLLYVPRLASSFDLSDTQTLMAGVSAAAGPNDTGSGARTEVVGGDLYWKWKAPGAAGGFPFVSFQTEVVQRRFDAGADAAAGLPAEVARDTGFYAQALWGFRRGWTAGLRGEWAGGNSTLADEASIYRRDRARYSPALTWFPTEFSKIRLQYNYDTGPRYGVDHSVWLQLEFMLGAHAAHKF